VTAPTGIVAGAGSRIRRRDRALTRFRLRRLDHRLDRSWRQAVAECDRVVLDDLCRRTGDAVVAITTPSGRPWGGAREGDAIVAAEVTFGSGAALRLGPCHAPAVAALAAAVATGPVVLTRVRRCNRLWILDFTGPEPRSLLARTVSHQTGGIRRPLAVA
jgi:hypothetical protein